MSRSPIDISQENDLSQLPILEGYYHRRDITKMQNLDHSPIQRNINMADQMSSHREEFKLLLNGREEEQYNNLKSESEHKLLNSARQSDHNMTFVGLNIDLEDNRYDNEDHLFELIEEKKTLSPRVYKAQKKTDIDSLHKKLERMDTNYSELEDMFNDEMRSKEMDIEQLDPRDMLQKESTLEFNELKRLEKEMRKVEDEKVTLLKKEGISEQNLMLTQGSRALSLQELEAQFEFKARERERSLTKLYGRLNAKIKSQILSNEGTSKLKIRKLPPFQKDKQKAQRMFEGIRDQKVSARWLKTPQPVEIKAMMIRGLKDKVPKGNYVIRCGILDRMIENKIYYKFIEYGAKVKVEQELQKERDEEQKRKDQEEMRNKHLFNTSSALMTQKDESKDKIAKNVEGDESGEGLVKGRHDDDEEKQLILFRDSMPSGRKLDSNSDADHQDEYHAVKFGTGVKKQEDDDLENETKTKNEHFRASLRQMNSKFKEGDKVESMNEQSDFDKMARYSMYKPQGGELTSNVKHQNMEKVWIDFGKQHTKLVEFDANPDSEEMKFGGHKLYHIVPPNMYLVPSNVLIFELIWLSSQTQKNDYVAAWGAFPLVNGDFEINEGKFKLPLLNGSIDYTSNKFKDIEKKYIRNIDEWLGNLYIQVKKFELVDFQMYNQKIEFKVPIEEQKKLKKERKAAQKVDKFQLIPKPLEMSFDQDGEAVEDQGAEKEKSDDESDFEDSHDQFYGFDDDDNIDYYSYRYKIQQSNYDLRSFFENKDLTIRKIQYVTGEILADLGIKKLKLWNGIQTLLIAFIVIWLRMIVHYLGQYIILKAMNAPVISLQLHWYKVRINYAFWNIGQEVAVITVGVVSNMIVLGLQILICYLSQKFIFCFPRSFCRFIAWYGLATVFDFFLIAVIDFAAQEWDGDLFKLYIYYNKANSSGFVGYFLTFIIQLGLLIVNMFIFYNYIVFVHLDGRLADIWSRISGKVKNFFIPHDNEVSFNYLRHLYQIGEINNNRIIVNKVLTNDAIKRRENTSKIVHFYKFESEVSLESGRVFYVNHKGQIQELNLNLINSKVDESNVDYYIKNIRNFIDTQDNFSPVLKFNGNDNRRNSATDLYRKHGGAEVFSMKRQLTHQSDLKTVKNKDKIFDDIKNSSIPFRASGSGKRSAKFQTRNSMGQRNSIGAKNIKAVYDTIKNMPQSVKSRKSNNVSGYVKVEDALQNSMRSIDSDDHPDAYGNFGSNIQRISSIHQDPEPFNKVKQILAEDENGTTDAKIVKKNSNKSNNNKFFDPLSGSKDESQDYNSNFQKMMFQ